jgi:hypothetical protein
MTIKARFGTFETNSSSTHSIVMCTKEEFEKFKNDELFLDQWHDKLLTHDEAVAKVLKDGYYTQEELDNMSPEEIVENAFNDSEIYTFETYGSDYEGFHTEYTTPNGETVVAFGYYGYDC